MFSYVIMFSSKSYVIRSLRIRELCYIAEAEFKVNKHDVHRASCGNTIESRGAHTNMRESVSSIVCTDKVSVGKHVNVRDAPARVRARHTHAVDLIPCPMHIHTAIHYAARCTARGPWLILD